MIITSGREHLMCMPYILKPSENRKDMFDLQVEDMTGQEMLDYLEDIFEGRLLKDKYGNTIQLKTPEEKYLFSKDIINHAFAYDMIKSKMTPMEVKKLNKILRV